MKCILPLILSLGVYSACKVTSTTCTESTENSDSECTTTTVDIEAAQSSNDPSAVSTDAYDPVLEAPTGLTDSVRGASLTDSPTIEWEEVPGAVKYELAIGVTQGGSDVLDWLDVGNVLTYTASGLTLINGETYYASVRAVNENSVLGKIAEGDGWQNLVCPSGFIKVPGNEAPGLGGDVYLEGTKSKYAWPTGPVATQRKISDFCVMKYEAKDGGSHTAVSVAAGTPWMGIPREEVNPNDDAQEACENIGTDFELIGNQHWQALARNIESVSENFGDYSGVGTSNEFAFNHGHADTSPNNALTADADDSKGCKGVTSFGLAEPLTTDDDCGGVWHINKRTHTLTNGEVIWDLSGNAYEWVRDDSNTSQGTNGYVYLETATDILKWGPANSYPGLNGTHKGGLGFYSVNFTAGAVLRGGNWSQGDNSGIFDVALYQDHDVLDSSYGFRCVYVP